MSTQQWLALDLLIVVLGAALFLSAGLLLLASRSGFGYGRTVAAALCLAAALSTGIARLAVLVPLLDAGWWFAADKATLTLPLAAVAAGFATVLAVPFLRRARRGDVDEGRRMRAAAGLLIGAYGSAAGVLVAFTVGYPVTATAWAVTVVSVTGVSGLTWVALGPQRRPGRSAVFTAAFLVPPLVAVSVAFYQNIQTVVVGAGGSGHGHAAAGPGTTGSGPKRLGEGNVSVTDLRTPLGLGGPVRRFTLTARQQAVTLPSGRTVDAWTFGSLPGPAIRVRLGDLVEVTVNNLDVADGVTAHWHGYPVPNGEDGVAGVTQDAVLPGQSFVYRFVATITGTFWYHAHQVGSEAVARGLFGAFVVDPAEPGAGVTDLVIPVHTIDGITMVGPTDGIDGRSVAVGRRIRLRLLNTDSAPHRISITGTPFTVTAVDGTALNEPLSVTDEVLRLPAAGRYDVEFRAPDGPVAIGVEGAPDTGIRLDPRGRPPGDTAPFIDATDLDLLSYGTPAAVPGMSGEPVDREATMVLDRQVRFQAGIPTLAQTINGDVFPHVPPIVVREGELVRLTVVNRGSETHPMHPHGHRVMVESRNGMPVGGSPIWLDTFDVQPGEVWTVLIRADNPGIWMSHCHNLKHAVQGMMIHLAYEGVSTPFQLGGEPDNRPE